MALLLARVDVLGDGEARGKHDFDAQQLAMGTFGGLEERHPRSEEGGFHDVSGMCHGAYSFPRRL